MRDDGVDRTRAGRIGAALVLAFVLYVAGYGALRATHVLLRFDGFSSPTPSIHVPHDFPHLQFLAPLYRPLAGMELWLRDVGGWR